MPKKHNPLVTEFWSTGGLLDQMYSRAILRSVPDIVERTRALQDISLSKISNPEAFAYLREAANCYISGFSLASMALSRAAVENLLRQVCAKHLGEEGVATEMFEHLIDRSFAAGILSKTARDLAHKVRRAGNALLHPKGKEQSLPTAAEALRVFETARIVIQTLHMH